MHCRNCDSESNYKNGIINGKQRYKCKNCGKNFLAKKVFNCSPTTIMNWIKSASAEVRMPDITDDIKEIEFDEMWHFIGSKKQKMDIQSH